MSEENFKKYERIVLASGRLTGKSGVALEIFQGLYKGVEYKVRPEGGGFYWQVGKTKGGKIFKEERDAINACKQYIESIK